MNLKTLIISFFLVLLIMIGYEINILDIIEVVAIIVFYYFIVICFVEKSYFKIGILVNIIGCISFINKFTDHKIENVISAIITYYIPIIVFMMEIYLNNKFPKEKSAISFSIILMTVFITVFFIGNLKLHKNKTNQYVNQINTNNYQNEKLNNINQNYVNNSQNNNLPETYINYQINKETVLDETSVENLGNNIYKGRFYNKNTYESYFISVDRNTCHYHTIQIIYNDGKDVKKYYTNKENRYFENTKKLCEFINK